MHCGLYRRWWINLALVALLSSVSLGFDVPPKLEYPPTPAEASRTYFQQVSQIIDQLDRRIGRCWSSEVPAMSVLCLRRAAIEINQVPTEYVDKDLVQWATQIRCQLDQAARQCKLARKEKVSCLKGSQPTHEKATDAGLAELRKEADSRVRHLIEDMLRNVRQTQLAMRSTMTQRYQVQF